MFGAVKVPVPPLPAILPVSNRCVAASVSVCATESLFVTVTFCPTRTVRSPEKRKLEIVMIGCAEAEDPADAAAVTLCDMAADDAGPLVVAESLPVPEEEQAVRMTPVTAVPAQISCRFIVINTDSVLDGSPSDRV